MPSQPIEKTRGSDNPKALSKTGSPSLPGNIKTILVAIIVTYEPNATELKNLLEAIASQVDTAVVVDNGSTCDVSQWIKESANKAAVFLPLNHNLGIARAQNAGIEWARAHNASHVVFFDQDSRPSPDMVEQLLIVNKLKTNEGYRVAAVGPRYMDERRYVPPPFIRVRGLRLQRLNCTQEAIVAVDYLISSGSLISMATLDTVGDMAEPFFIDYVDIEWGLRAKKMGFSSFGVCTATMVHSLGEEPARFFGYRFPVHSPLRHYYHFRNAVYMYWWMNVPRNWKAVDGSRLLLKFFFYSLVTKPRTKHFLYMTKGILDGIRGRMGKI